MSENKDKKFPRSDADKRGLIDHKFPADKPIFWGPNQFTQFPDTYNEPSGWRTNELLRIPQVLRLFTGGELASADVFRFIYLGRRHYYGTNMFHTSDGTYGAGQFVGYGWFNLTETQAFEVYENIASAYGANKSTEQLLESYIIKETHVSQPLNGDGTIPVVTPPMRDVSMSLVENTYYYGIPAGDLVGKRPMQSGSHIGADGDIPVGSIWDVDSLQTYKYTGQDSEGDYPDEGSWNGDETAKVGPHKNKILRRPSSKSGEYFFLRNIISGGVQINFLHILPYGPDRNPDSEDWDTLLFQAGNPSYASIILVTGLELEP